MSIKHKVAYFFVAVSLLFASCDNDSNCINGIGAITTEDLTLSSFDGIKLDNSLEVTISQGTTQEVKAIGHPNIISELKLGVSNNFWEIELENGCYNDFELEIQITVPNIKKIEVDGSGIITLNDFSNQSTLKAEISGSGEIILNQFEGATNFEIEVDGSGSFISNTDISTLDVLDLNISGSGGYFGLETSSNACTIDLSGSGTGEVTAINTLDVVIDGSGVISYKGTPMITQDISGSGRLIDAN